MCGIAGWIDFNRDINKHKDTYTKMSNSLSKRGPYDSGICNF